MCVRKILIGLYLMALSSSSCVTANEKPILLMTPEDIYINANLRRLSEAAKTGDTQTINALAEQGTDVNTSGRHGVTPIFFALQGESIDGLRALLDHGANPNVVWDTGNTAVHLAVRMENSEFLAQLLESGADINVVNPRLGETPIFEAVTPRGKKHLSMIIAAGAILDFSNKTGITPLMRAASLNQYDAALLLLKCGADYKKVNRWNKDITYYVDLSGETMDEASDLYKRRQEVVEFLRAKQFWTGN